MSGNALVLEDSTDADLRPRDIARPSLQHATPERVVHFGSVSRSLAPGLRLGWIVAPEAMVGIVARAKARSDLGPAVLEQIAFARFLAAGELDRHLRRLRLEYGQRRDALVVALAEAVPELSVHVPSIGFHLLARLPARRTEEELVGAMRANGVRVAGLAEHTLAGPPLPPTLLLGYANVPQAAAPSVASALRLALSRRS